MNAIFGPYWNGEKEVYADPIRVYRVLSSRLDGDINEALKRYLADPANNDRVLAAASEALAMAPFDPVSGLGATVDDIERALFEFTEYVRKNGLRGEKRPTCWQHTQDSPPSSPPTHSSTFGYG
jgi:hypothetical protein